MSRKGPFGALEFGIRKVVELTDRRVYEMCLPPAEIKLAEESARK